jgi:hypothetical protein
VKEEIGIEILYITPVLLHPAAGGPALRVENSIKALTRIAKIHIISFLPISQIGGKFAEEFYNQLSYKFEFAPSAVLNEKFRDLAYGIKHKRAFLNLCLAAIRKFSKLFRVMM